MSLNTKILESLLNESKKKGDETICSVLKEWLRVTTVGAIIAFTHKVTLFFLKRIEFFVCGVYDI